MDLMILYGFDNFFQKRFLGEKLDFLKIEIGNLSIDLDHIENYSIYICSPFDTLSGLGRGYFFFNKMATEPSKKRIVAFFDGQNLFHGAKEAFGYGYPNFSPRRLALTICQQRGWELSQTRFYTGVPDKQDNANWNHFWRAKLAHMGRTGVFTFSRSLRYRNQTVQLPNGTQHTFLVAQEKGVDVRIALDVVRLGHEQEYDVALIFSQDQDLSEAADEIRRIAQEQNRWIKVASAFPVSPTSRNKRVLTKQTGFQLIEILIKSASIPEIIVSSRCRKNAASRSSSSLA
jgi:uncharacterized LabA/DUF88 family protein